MPRALALPVFFAGLIGCAVGCATSQTNVQVSASVARGAYADAWQLYEHAGHDRSVLRTFAESILLIDAQSAEAPRQHAAFNELAMLGTRSRSALEQLAEAPHSNAVRAKALALLWHLGDSDARDALRPMAQDTDSDVADTAFVALDPERDHALILQALRAGRSLRRLAAVSLLARRAAPEDLSPLLEVARLDPEPSVRAAALSALERYAGAARSAFERALQDDVESVRIAGLEAMARATPEQAVPYLDQQLGAAMTRQTLAAAAALLRLIPAREPARARDAMLRGLLASEPSMRGYAAVLLRTLRATEQDSSALRSCLSAEASADVKLGLALALGTSDPAARAALVALEQGMSLPAAQAAAELGRLGDPSALPRLLSLRASPSNATRASVARALGRELHAPEHAAVLLSDRDPSVRVAAAGAVLRGLQDS